MTAYYQEYLLNPALRPYIECVWTESYTQLPANRNRTYLVVPDNTVELIFTQNVIERQPKGSREGKLAVRSHVSGLKTAPQEVRIQGATLLSVRFRPHGLYPFVLADLSETVDHSIEASALFGKDIAVLEQQLLETSLRVKQLELVEQFFLKRLALAEEKKDYKFEFLAGQAIQHKGRLKIKELAREARVSVKTVERKFLQKLGILPKQYCRILRFCDIVKQSAGSGTAQLDYYRSFYDQTHFIKELKAFTGLTPGEYLKLDKGVQTPIFSD